MRIVYDAEDLREYMREAVRASPLLARRGPDRNAARADESAGEGARSHRPHQRAVRDPERDGLRPRGEPARLADCALRLEGDRAAAREGRDACDAGPPVGTLRRVRRP